MKTIKKWILTRSVHTKIASTIMLVVGFFAITATAINIYTVKYQIDKMVSEFIELNIHMNEDYIVKSLLAEDYWGTYKFLKSISKNGFINKIGFIDEDENIVAHTDTLHYKTGNKYIPIESDINNVRFDLKSSEILLGYFVIGYKPELAENLFVTPALINIVLFLIAAIISVILGVWINKRLLKRLFTLVENTKALSENKFDSVKSIDLDEDDEISHIIRTITDLMNTIKLSIDRELELKDFYHQTLACINIFILILDENLDIVFENKHPIGDEIINRKKNFIYEDSVKKLNLNINDRFNGKGKAFQIENKNLRLLINIKYIADKIIITYTDITKIQELERHIALSRSLAMVGEISSTFTHEIKNLLQPAKLLLADIDNIDKQDIKIISSILEKMDGKVIKLLNIGRPLDKTLSDLLNCAIEIEKVLFLMGSELEKKNITVLNRADKSATVYMSRNIFESILIDLISNAIDALDENGKIIIGVEKISENMSKIRIEDNGKGIDEDIRERVFEPFFTTKEKGSGIGLFGVYRNVYQYGGFINLTSSPGLTKFDIYLPS